MDVKTVIGDAAYSEKRNIAFTKKNEMDLVAKRNLPLHKTIEKEKMNLNLIKMQEGSL